MPEPREFPRWSGSDRRLAPIGVAAILLASTSFFWHARDWNSASRLMLTYAIVDHGTIRLDPYRVQTNDIAAFGGHFYTDKQPGYSIAAAVPYAIAKAALGLPDHPEGPPALTHWPGDYWATLGTAGLATAIGAAVLVVLAGRAGCGPRASSLVGLAYGLATPAYAYASMSYGHQLASACLLGSLALVDRPGTRRPGLALAASGFLAAFASVVELSVGPISALLGCFAIGKVATRSLPPKAICGFVLGASVPTLVLLGYNAMAFGNPLDIGYAHHATQQFAEVHSADNPLGLRAPDWSKAVPLLWGRHRGLFFYAPILLLAPVGWAALLVRGKVGLGLVAILASLAVFLVNVSYPEWTGGWSTGPRLLVPLIPFGMLGVAGALAVGGRGAAIVAGILAIAGGALILLFQGVGAQIPQDVPDPLVQVAWPLWSGGRIPRWWLGDRFTRTIPSVLAPGWVGGLPTGRQWLQFAPLLVGQAVAIGLLMVLLGRGGRARIET
ncbi:hypothetical protein [Tautonia plasticadhaerens]|uniref:Glycosyltransferase RgtA/B/C/D-like domain-containing protein n=1 Tax=Tautonia plasticadhaerens TaxID=2527974 RepID=A0A518HAP1_9BACT|nr:hypothetical protein [Tautonia plasticadhaerens]QDV37925.1 hypothetical protein ElP_58720 [Tautonia plasticadhaerens]